MEALPLGMLTAERAQFASARAPARAAPLTWVDVVRPRLLRRLEAARGILIGGAGTGKTTLLHHLAAAHVGGERMVVLPLGPEHGDVALLEDTLSVALRSEPRTVALDNAEHVVRGPTADLVARILAAHAERPRVIFASRSMPDFPLARAEFAAVCLVEECELLLRLDELMDGIRRQLGVRVSPNTAARILDATGGWPAAVRMLLLHVQAQGPARADPDLLDALTHSAWREPVWSVTDVSSITKRLPDPARSRPTGGSGLSSLAPSLLPALHTLARGDVVTATRMLDALVRSAADPSDAWAARLALLVIRAPLLGTDDTADALFRFERDASIRGMAALARLARGVLAAAAALPGGDTALRDSIAACAADGDAVEAATLQGLALLWQLRSGVAPSSPDAVIDLAERFDDLGCPDAAGWIAAVLVLAGMDGEDVESSDIDSRIAALRERMTSAARSLVAAAEARDGERSRRLRAAALGIGLPRLPAALRPPEPAPPRQGTGGVLRSPDAPVVLTCFGSFHLRIGGRDVDISRVRPQARTLLRLLALSAGEPVHREWIAEIIWPDLPLDSAVHALHVSVSSLRRALNEYGHGTGGRLVERRGHAYALRLDPGDRCDLVSFDSGLAAATAARSRGDADMAMRELWAAVDLYLGDVLPEDGPADWVVGTRERYRTRAAEAAAALAMLELRRSGSAAALRAAERAVEIDPWTDAAWRALTAVHRSADDLIALARTEERYHRMLRSLGVR